MGEACGEFSSCLNFFLVKCSMQDFFLAKSLARIARIFSGLLAVHDFFSRNFPLVVVVFFFFTSPIPLQRTVTMHLRVLHIN